MSTFLRRALRRFRREPGYFLIHLVGLATGLAVCFLIASFVRWELSYDDFHTRADRIFRVTYEMDLGGSRAVMSATPGPMGPAIESSVPEVEEAVRVQPMIQPVIRRGESTYYEDRLFLHVEPEALEVFTWPLTRGEAQSALQEPYSVVLSEGLARKYFGRADVVGETLLIGDEAYSVTGVMENLPQNTHLRPEALVSFSTLQDANQQGLTSWKFYRYGLYVLTREAPDVSALRAQVEEAVGSRSGSERLQEASFTLEPLPEVYLHSPAVGGITTGDPRYLYIFSAVGVLILLLAAVNYTNLATARSSKKAVEIGVRKALGADRRALAGHLLGRSVLISGAAFLLALALTAGAIPVVNNFIDANLGAVAWSPGMWGLFGAVSVGVGLLGGAYPALVLSRLAPSSVLRAKPLGGAGSGRLRQGLVVFQLAVSIGLLGCTFIIDDQLEFVQTRDLGLNEEQVVVVPIRNAPIPESQEGFVAELRRNPAIRSVTFSSPVPTRQGTQVTFRRPSSVEEEHMAALYRVEPNFFETMEIEIVKGEAFTEADTSRTPAPVIINQYMADLLGWTDPVGRRLFTGDTQVQIAGVVEDFHFQSLHQAIEPIMIRPLGEPGRFFYASIRFQAADAPDVVDTIRTTWQQFAGAAPFDYFFLDQAFANQYRSDRQIARLFRWFAGIAVLIACLGLVGLAAYMAQRRSKEISVRKVLGATITSVLGLLGGEFLRLAAMALILGLPASYFGIQWWLQDFAYRVDPGVGVFLTASAAGVGVVLLAVGYHTVRAALTNPAETLRYE